MSTMGQSQTTGYCCMYIIMLCACERFARSADRAALLVDRSPAPSLVFLSCCLVELVWGGEVSFIPPKSLFCFRVPLRLFARPPAVSGWLREGKARSKPTPVRSEYNFDKCNTNCYFVSVSSSFTITATVRVRVNVLDNSTQTSIS